MTVKMSCTVKYIDRRTELFDAYWLHWKGLGKVMWFTGEKGRDVARLNPDLVRKLDIQLSAE